MRLVSRSEAKSAGLKRYFTGSACSNGHVAERFVSTYWCVECRKCWQTKWNSDNRAQLNEHARESKRRQRDRDPKGTRDKLRDYRFNNLERTMLWGARSRAKRQGLAFNLSLEDILIPEHCPLLGIKLVARIDAGKPSANSPSLDKIDPALGYVKGNVRVVSYKANTMKQDASPDLLVSFALNVLAEAGWLVIAPRAAA